MKAPSREFGELLALLEVEPNASTSGLVQQGLALIHNKNYIAVAQQAEVVLYESTRRHDRFSQAIAYAYLAATDAAQGNYNKAVRRAKDSQQLFQQMREQGYNSIIARSLVALVYRVHIDALSRSMVATLQEGRMQIHDLESKVLRKGNAQLASKYHQYFVEFGDLMRRANWIPAVTQLHPLVWLAVVDHVPSDPGLSPEIEGYMEPALFVLRTKQEVQDEESGELDSGQIVDMLYTAQPLPRNDDQDGVLLPRLKQGAVYTAVKVDAENAAQEDYLKPDDYLLVRQLGSHEREGLIKRAGNNFTGLYFRVKSSGEVELINAIPPKFVGEESVRMFVAQVDALLRRVQ